MKKILLFLYKIRRELLKVVVPEFFWPKQVVLDDSIIPVRGMKYSFGVKRLLTLGNYETSERALIKKIVKPGDRVVEMGGSIGIVASILSEIVGTSGFVYSIEAIPRLTSESVKWLERKNNIKVLTGYGFPVFRTPNKYKQIDFIDNGNSLGGQIDFTSIGQSEVETQNIFDLDTIEKMFNFQPNILVLDIEGSEIVFLEKDAIIPEFIKSIIIEMHPNLYGGKTEEKIIQILIENGFQLKEEISHVYLLSKD